MAKKVIKSEIINFQVLFTVEHTSFFGGKKIKQYLSTNYVYVLGNLRKFVEYPSFKTINSYDDLTDFLNCKLQRFAWDNKLDINITE